MKGSRAEPTPRVRGRGGARTRWKSAVGLLGGSINGVFNDIGSNLTSPGVGT